MLFKRLEASGGYPETLFFGSASFTIATYLACSRFRDDGEQPGWRVLAYFAWGLCAGLGLWSDLLVAPYVGMSALLLAVSCRRDLVSMAGVLLVIGLVSGAFPLIWYNLHAQSGLDSFHQLLSQQSGAHNLGLQLVGTMLVTIPTATGGASVCTIPPDQIWPVGAHPAAHTIACTALHGLWTTGLVALFVGSIYVSATVCLVARRGERENLVPRCCSQSMCHMSSLLLLAAAATSTVLFILNPAAAVSPRTSARYLNGLLIATPALIAPLSRHFGADTGRRYGPRRHVTIRGIAFTSLLAALVLGTLNTLTTIPVAQQQHNQDAALIAHLVKLGAADIYTEYWICDKLAFFSTERIICSVLDAPLRPGWDRYLPYRARVRAASRPFFLFTPRSPQDQLLIKLLRGYTRSIWSNYAIYAPACADGGQQRCGIDAQTALHGACRTTRQECPSL
jgi:hypothetical protein